MIQNPALADVQVNDEIDGFYLLTDATVRSSANGSHFLSATLSDRSGSISLKMWDYTGSIGPGDNGSAVRVRGTVGDYKGVKQLTARRLRLALPEDNVDPGQLVPTAPIDPVEALEEIRELIRSMADEDYLRIAETLFSRNEEKFSTVPAAKSVHHGFHGGLLMHTLNMLRTADYLADLYAEVINRDLLLAGTLLHDLAKIREFSLSPLGIVRDYSVEGQLLGHLVMGAQEAANAAEELGTPKEKAVLLQHLILSHHGEPEFGAAVRPMCAEAELLHLIDMMDSRMEIYAETLHTTDSGSFSERIFALDRKVYKPSDME